jgi:hypothetical protein
MEHPHTRRWKSWKKAMKSLKSWSEAHKWSTNQNIDYLCLYIHVGQMFQKLTTLKAKSE